MNSLLRDFIIMILVLVNCSVGVYYGVSSMVFSLTHAMTDYSSSIIVLIMACVAMVGHLYIVFSLLKFSPASQLSGRGNK